MNTFDPRKRHIKDFKLFNSQADRVHKEDKSKHKMVDAAYSGPKDGKKGREVLDDRDEKKGKHETVKSNYSGERKGAAGTETMDNE